MNIELINIESLIPYDKNPRNNQKAVPEVMKSLKKFGFRQPIVVDKDMIVVVGHTRLIAAKKLGLRKVPVHIASDMTEAEAKAYRLMDNRTSDHAEWDKNLLIGELDDLLLEDATLDMEFLGFINFDLLESKPEKEEKTKSIDEPKQEFLVVVECLDENEQEQVFKDLQEQGRICKIL